MINKAKSLFHGVEKYNCAQAVLAAFEDSCGVSADTINEFKAFGGGRAQEGYCGALYAALHLAEGDEVLVNNLKQAFIEKAGALTCKEIKSVSKLACIDCVGLAAQVLSQH